MRSHAFWCITLISDPEFAGSKSLEQYIAAVEGGTDSLKAARDAFGDLTQLQAKLDAFVKNVSGPPAEIAIPAANDSGGAPRTLPAAEIEAREADFLAFEEGTRTRRTSWKKR